jgi:RHS repeat-associated protein
MEKTYKDGNIKNFQYDSLNRLIREYDKASDYYYTYDNNGNVLSKYDAKNKDMLSYQYDEAGNRIKMDAKATNLPHKIVSYQYDGLNKLTFEAATDDKGLTNIAIGYSYDSMGMITNKVYSTGLSIIYYYDAIYRMTGIINYTNYQLFSSFGYAYDKVGNRVSETAITTTNTPGISTFVYDKKYQLIAADYGNGHFEKFEYDNCYNRLVKEDENGKVFSVFDNDNRLMLEQSANGNTRFVYDKNGRNIQKIHSGTNSYTENYTYDSRDLMIRYMKEDSSGNKFVCDYIYDVDNLRVGKTENVNGTGTIMDVLKHFSYDGQNLLSDGTAFYLNNIAVNTYEGEIYGDRNVAYLKDAIGTVRGELYDHPIVDKLTSVETSFKSFSYTAFGEQINIDANTNDTTSGGVHEGIGFTGHYGDSESGLYYARARYLDPSVGRWTVRDSFTDYSPSGLNKYQDCQNNPARFVDPMGTDDEPYITSGVQSKEDDNTYYLKETYAETSGGGSAYTMNIGRDNKIFGIDFGWLTRDVAVLGYDNKGNESSSNWAHIDASHNISDYLPQFLANANQANEYMANVYDVIAQQKTPLTAETDMQMQNYVEKESRKAEALQYGSVAEDGLPQNTSYRAYISQPMQFIGGQINVNNITDNGKPKTLNDRADEVFYQLHPEYSGLTIAEISKNNPEKGKQLAQEWQGIKNGIQYSTSAQQNKSTGYETLSMQTTDANFFYGDYYKNLKDYYLSKREQSKEGMIGFGEGLLATAAIGGGLIVISETGAVTFIGAGLSATASGGFKMWDNYSKGKPLMEGVGEQAAYNFAETVAFGKLGKGLNLLDTVPKAIGYGVGFNTISDIGHQMIFDGKNLMGENGVDYNQSFLKGITTGPITGLAGGMVGEEIENRMAEGLSEYAGGVTATTWMGAVLAGRDAIFYQAYDKLKDFKIQFDPYKFSKDYLK